MEAFIACRIAGNVAIAEPPEPPATRRRDWNTGSQAASPGRDAAGLHCIQIFAMLKGQEIKAPMKPASKPPQ